jgi:acyl carrier protein
LLTQRSISRTVEPADDLRDAGLTSMDMVNLVLAVETEFDVMIPESRITPANFRSVAAISSLIEALQQLA